MINTPRVFDRERVMTPQSGQLRNSSIADAGLATRQKLSKKPIRPRTPGMPLEIDTRYASTNVTPKSKRVIQHGSLTSRNLDQPQYSLVTESRLDSTKFTDKPSLLARGDKSLRASTDSLPLTTPKAREFTRLALMKHSNLKLLAIILNI